MLLPPVGARIDIQVAEWAAVSSSQWLGGKALFLFDVCLVGFLMDGLLAPGTLFIVLTIGAFAHQVGGECVDFDALPAFTAYDEHRTGIEVVHVLIVLLNKSFVHSLAEFAYLVFVNVI